jgi:hypothetical protein
LGIVLYELFHKRNPFVDEDKAYEEEEFVAKRDRLEYSINNNFMTQ